MIDIQLLRNDLDTVAARLASRNFTLDTEAFASLENERKALQTRMQELQATRNATSKRIGQAKAKGEDVASIMAEVASLGDELKCAETAFELVQDKLNALLLTIPNLDRKSVV